MVERADRARMITFVAQASLAPGDVSLDDAAANHASVRRLKVGDEVSITEGRGSRGTGRVAELSKKALTVTVEKIERVPLPPAIHLFVPVADKDRMLWLAEKATELQATTWTPVIYRRSMSVTPRGEGDAFDKKVKARMISALEQSHGAWLPVIRPISEATRIGTAGQSIVLDRGGVPLGSHSDADRKSTRLNSSHT